MKRIGLLPGKEVAMSCLVRRRHISKCVVLLSGIAFLSTMAIADKWSLRERKIRKKLPVVYAQHKDGIVASPSDKDVTDAIALGELSKNKQILEYAYISKPNLKSYVVLETPLFLIANHARTQAAEYFEVDKDFIDYCRSLGVVKIGIQTQAISSVTSFVYASQHKVILLRDGKRVPHLTQVSAFHGENPFLRFDPATKAILDSTKQMAKAYEKIWKDQLNAQGITVPGLPGGGSEIALTEFNGVFSVEELRKPGEYEVVFRLAPSASIYASTKTKEYRYPIDFSRFR